MARHGVKPANAMKTISGTLPLKPIALAASVTVLIILISGCEKSPPGEGRDHPNLITADRPVFVIFHEPGVKTKGDLNTIVKPAFQKLGEHFCNVKAYHDNGSFAWQLGDLPALKMTSATRSGAAEASAAADPVNLVQRVAFATLDDAQTLFSTINPTPTPTP